MMKYSDIAQSTRMDSEKTLPVQG
ncbi:uncharacterized protein METZ01_LOCUS278953 [marine metagenome]|uniref:Uncharacterized protein n=1 Tax=marine metagenome TaxID=408172 RepID=A0A382KPB0_9ZZZZ